MASNEESHAAYTFYPVVRAGHRPESTHGEVFPTSSRMDVTLAVEGRDGKETTEEQTSVEIFLYGPGEVTGLDKRQIVRREPEPNTDGYPPTQFPVIEFDRPDLPWLFSPQQADSDGRVLPWMCLVAVDRDAPDVAYNAVGPGSCPTITAPVDELPVLEEAYAWAHAQHLGMSTEDANGPRLEVDSPHARSRLVCPRNLESQTRYRACVVPVFEPGRQAGLGRTPDTRVSLSWTSDSGPVTLPVYDSWTFTTSAEGDFVALATDLEPTVLGPSIGVRPVDVSKPGPTALKQPGEGPESTVGLEGALQSPSAADTDDPYTASAATELKQLLNRAIEIDASIPEDVVAPPLYGRWHANRSRVDASDETITWFDALNVDPRYRLAAGFGTRVIQREQERWMARAWEQFGELREVNAYLSRSQLVRESLRAKFEAVATKHVGRLLQITGPVHPHVFLAEEQETLVSRLAKTTTPIGLTIPEFRRLTNPQGPLARRAGVRFESLDFAHRIQTGAIPGYAVPDVGPVTDSPSEPHADEHPHGAALSQGRFGRWGGYAFGDLSPQYATPTPSGEPTQSPGGPNFLVDQPNEMGRAHERPVDRRARQRVLTLLTSVERHCLVAQTDIRALRDAMVNDDAEAVARLHNNSPSVLDRCGSITPNTVNPLAHALGKLVVDPRPPTIAQELTQAFATTQCDDLRDATHQLTNATETAIDRYTDDKTDSRAADAALTTALTTLSRMLDIIDRLRAMIATEQDDEPPPAESSMAMLMGDGEDAVPATTPDSVDPAAFKAALLEEINPDVQLPVVVADRLDLPSLLDRDDPLAPVMAAPTFEHPMAESLIDIDSTLLLPGISEVPRDSVGIVQTNPAFIEAFMAGVNHEMARLLRWRRFPTDQRGTCFDRFWDHRHAPTDHDATDITPLHTWSGSLGSNHPDADEDPTAVLLIRGELLRRYPNTTVYAAKAIADDPADPTTAPDRIPAVPNTPVDQGHADTEATLEFPMFTGQLESDIAFYGFDLSIPEARHDPYHDSGPAPESPDDHDDEGWFFVFEEPPAEPRFGRLTRTDAPQLPPNTPTGEYVSIAAGPPAWWLNQEGHVDATDNADINADDLGWGHNGAHMAEITWQHPRRVAIHASELIPAPTDGTPVVGTTLHGSAFDDSFQLVAPTPGIEEPGLPGGDGA